MQKPHFVHVWPVLGIGCSKHIGQEGICLRRSKETKQAPRGLIVNSIIGAFLALGIALVLLFAFSIFVVSGWLPEGMMGAMTVVALFLSSTAGAGIAIRRHRARSLFVGLLQGAVLYAITVVGGAISPIDALFGVWSIQLFLAALLGGAAAGFLGAGKKRRRV